MLLAKHRIKQALNILLHQKRGGIRDLNQLQITLQPMCLKRLCALSIAIRIL